MRILTNEFSEIIAYSMVGSLENDVEINNDIVPQDFMNNFKPRKYLYSNGLIIINESYEDVKEHDSNSSNIDLSSNTDDQLRKMFANMQNQLVQMSTTIARLTQQNADMSKQFVELQDEIEILKGENGNENVIS